ncbi:Di-copper centre-containing protein [Gymnopus androsaceus JB14]|uniref:tyrosinase n=1 Tax=Gymnopus androsaceus JB14 TaxID=1447944 RepID=A0A6A4HHG2_9AGAR|nr:Di-copper centre-containing protein [Gymnopus androsaceus JB14]
MSQYYLVTGRKDSDGTIYDRLEIEELQKQPQQFSLFILAYLALQGRDNNPNVNTNIPQAAAFPELAGIHGLLFREWVGDRKKTEEEKPDFNPKDPKDTNPVPSRFGGYCNHGSVVFPTWHRPYVLALEQAIGNIATEIAETFAKLYPKEANVWKQAARELRFPFWDWADKKVKTDGIPAVLSELKVKIAMPEEVTKAVDNPLAFYRFESIPDGFENEVLNPQDTEVTAYFKDWTRTYRYAQSTLTPDGNGTAQLNEKELIKYDAMSQIYSLLMKEALLPWYEFSNHTTESLRKRDYYNVCSLEGIHDLMHDTIGGNGHMSDHNYAGFDPIFFLHHCNVDRLLALWEYVYPKCYTVGKGYTHGGKTYPFTQARGTYNLVYNSQLIGKTPLAPFRNSKEQYWTSDETHYSYPEVNGVKVGKDITEKQRKEARKKLQEYYALDKPRELKLSLPVKFHAPARDHLPSGYKIVEDYRRMIIVVQTSEFAFNGPYSIQIYFKNTSNQTEEYIGLVAVFARPDRCKFIGLIKDAGSTIRGIIPIPLYIVEETIKRSRITSSSESNLEEAIAKELKESLYGKIVNREGKEVGRATGGMKISDEDSLEEHLVPDITLVSSAAIRSENGPDPIEWADWLNHGKVFEKDSSWKRAARHHFNLLSDSCTSPPANVVYEDDLLDNIWPAAATLPNDTAASDALIAAALEDVGDSNDWEDDLTSEVELRASRNHSGPCNKKIKLVDLFRYPSPDTPKGDWLKHWHFNKSLLDVAENVEAEAAEAQAGEMDNCT